jgi:hypothetical protein
MPGNIDGLVANDPQRTYCITRRPPPQYLERPRRQRRSCRLQDISGILWIVVLGLYLSSEGVGF